MSVDRVNDIEQSSMTRLRIATFRVALLCVLGAVLEGMDLAATFLWRKLARATPEIRIDSPIYHHDLRKSHFAWNRLLGEMPTATNSLGFRDAAVRDVPLQNVSQKRVLFIGDSFTEGVNVEFKDTFAGILSKEWQEKGIEVLNAGVSSYSPIIYLRKIQYLLDIGLKFDAAIVFIDSSDVRDELRYCFDGAQNVVNCDERERAIIDGPGESKLVFQVVPPWRMYLTANTTLTRHLISRYHEYRFGCAGPVHEGPLMVTDEGLYKTFGVVGFQRADEHMSQLESLLRAQGIPLAIAVYPWPQQVQAGDLASRQVTFWQEWAKRANVPFVNLFPTFIDGRDSERVIEDEYICGDVHWNRSGHRKVAEALEAHHVLSMLLGR